MVGDGNKVYDKSNDGKETELMGCSARGIRGASVPTKAKLTYFQDKSLRLELQYKSEDSWELCFETSEPPTIPSVAYLGFSAETGELSDNHDIISVSTKNLYDTKGRDSTMNKPGNKGASQGSEKYSKKKEGSSWSWFFFKVLMFFMVMGGAYAGFTAWRAQKGRSHRF